MSLKETSKHFDNYYDHSLNIKKSEGNLGKVYDIIYDIRGRSGLENIFEEIDADIQDEIIDKWVEILNK